MYTRARGPACPTALLEEGVLVRIGGSTATEKAERHRRPDLVPGAWRDQSRIPRFDLTDLAVELQRALALEHDVDLFAATVIVPLGCLPRLERRLRKTLEARVVELPNRRAVFRRERLDRFP